VRSDFFGASGTPRQLDHVPFDLNRVSPLDIAGLDPTIRALKDAAAALPQWFRLRQVSMEARVKPAHDERDYRSKAG
jgi:hypothetical protein